MNAFWEKMVLSHEAAIEKLEAGIRSLELRKTQRQRLLAEARLRTKGIKACKACRRLVASPCNDRAGYQEGGPWDFHCKDVLYGDVS